MERSNGNFVVQIKENNVVVIELVYNSEPTLEKLEGRK
jgi:hypothetical protein